MKRKTTRSEWQNCRGKALRLVGQEMQLSQQDHHEHEYDESNRQVEGQTIKPRRSVTTMIVMMTVMAGHSASVGLCHKERTTRRHLNGYQSLCQ